MKLAYLTGEYPRATDTFIQREIAGLRELGVEVETCSIRRTGAEHLVGEEQRVEATRTFHVLEACRNPLRLAATHLRLMRQPSRYFGALKLAWQSAPKGLKGRLYNLIYFAEAGMLARHMTSQGVTHLHNHIAKSSCTVAMLAARLSGLPFSFTLHGPDIFFAPEHWRLDLKIAEARFVSCISDFARSQAMLFSDQQHWSKLHIVHCSVDPARYQPGERSGNELVFVGRLAGVKGVPVLLEALRKTLKTQPDLHLTLIGDGPERPQLQAAAEDLPVEFTGYLSQSETAERLARADCLILPSFAEGVPVVLMEAMAARLPVIATRVGGVSELVEEGRSGLMVAPGDAESLAAAILSLMSDPDRRREMGEAGRAKIEAEFTSATESARLLSLFNGEANEKRPARWRSP